MTDPRVAHLVKVVSVFSVELVDVPHQEIHRASTEKCLVHPSVVELAGTVVELDPDVSQSVAKQFNSNGADFFRGPSRRRSFRKNDAVHQAESDRCA